MKLLSLDDVLLHELKDLYSAETQILAALPKMIDASTHPSLTDGLKSHLKETRSHVDRLDEVAQILNQDLTGETCDGMKGLITEGEKVLQMSGDDQVIDAAIIAAAQRIEHYEIAGYGCAVAFAQELGKEEVASLLQETLDEEGDANKSLTTVAEGGIFSQGVNEKAEKVG